MKDQRTSLEQQLREMIQKDDITTSLVTTDRSEMKVRRAGRRVGLPRPAQGQVGWPRRVEGMQCESTPLAGFLFAHVPAQFLSGPLDKKHSPDCL